MDGFPTAIPRKNLSCMSESRKVSKTEAMEHAKGYPATLDGIATCTLSKDQQSQSNNVARRSTSIFSRRGTMTPEPASQVLLDAVEASKQSSTKQRGWVLRRSRQGSPMSPKTGFFKSPRGTVLHAVPPANIIRLSALEEEMARSPNDEILSAISEHPPAPGELATPSYHRDSEFLQLKATSPSKANATRIGVWVDGVVHWNEGLSAGVDLSHVRSSVFETQANRQRPSLTVTIPSGESRPIPRIIYQPQPRRPISSTKQVSHSAIPLIERPQAPHRRHSPVPRSSRSSTSCSSIDEDTSVCSNRSSATSIELSASIPLRKIPAPTNAGPSWYMQKRACNAANDLTANDGPGELYQVPPTPGRAAPFPLTMRDQSPYKPSCTTPSIRPVQPREATMTSLHTHEAGPLSPTWSQAEHDLQRELSTGHKDHDSIASPAAIQELSGGSVRRSGSVRTVLQPPDRVPTIPKRSRRRDWITHVAYPVSELRRRQSEVPRKVAGLSQDNGILRKSVSVSCDANPLTKAPISKKLTTPPPPRSARRPISTISAKDSRGPEIHQDRVSARREAIITAMTPTASAEDVLLHILARLHSPRDLFRTAIINKGMYRVFQENQIHLLRTVVFNESPALWELLEWGPSYGSNAKCSNNHTQIEPTSTTYMRCYQREKTAMGALKRLILEACQTFLRRDTVMALSASTHPNAQRFDDALWRISTFCQIFGSARNREDDITGQMDWLKGGVLANNEDCIASTEPNMDFDLRSVLISPPACFAESNRGGLSASQLFDMTEMWTCMTALLHGYHGRVGQARYYGIFDQCEVEEGDIEKEAEILEEWTAYLLTLGPSVVLEVAQLYPAAGFALARDSGWTQWTPPIHNGSRSSFLKEPVAKSYEEQMIMAKQLQQDPREQVRKDASRRRVATLAAEIRVRRQSSAYKRCPLIDMTTERAMSMSSRRDSVLDTRDCSSRETGRCISSATPRSSIGLRKSHAIVAISEETSNPRDIVESAEGTSERAIQQLVMMGFEHGMVVDALRITDRGDGLCPERAVDLLLRQ